MLDSDVLESDVLDSDVLDSRSALSSSPGLPVGHAEARLRMDSQRSGAGSGRRRNLNDWRAYQP